MWAGLTALKSVHPWMWGEPLLHESASDSPAMYLSTALGSSAWYDLGAAIFFTAQQK